jgi:phosphatidylserine decarboxylase
LNQGREKTPARGLILREGYPFIAPFLVLAIVGYGVGWPGLGGAALVLAAGVALFFRNPTRKPLRLPGLALAPADGRVVEVAQVASPEAGSEPVIKVSIFMSVFNVHVNRSPVAGEVVEVRHEPGAFRPAYRDETSGHNERNLVRIRMGDGREVTCVQVAGVLARRIVCWVRQGARLAMGAPLGMIRFGSRVDCYFPSGFDVDVRVGQRVWGGETVLGYFPGLFSREQMGLS